MHIGHAINKILKDITNRNKVLRGCRVHYVPGWDCHGLPIELKAVSEKENLSPIEIRSKAREFARNAVETQRKAFRCWGVMADWQDGCYFTYEPDYIKKQLRMFLKMYEKGYIYRDLKPVYWSPSSRTALAEAELEYNDNHVSIAATVKMKLTFIPDALLNLIIKDGVNVKCSDLYALIWTTTPWTLPGNRAICYSEKLEYVIAKTSENHTECLYLLAKDACQDLEVKIGKPLQIITSFSGQLLHGVRYMKPFSEFGGETEELHFLPGSHVTAEKGTGLVHTAPAHGHDDFVVALSNNLPLDCYVNENGCFTAQLAHIGIEGLFVLSDETNRKVLSLLDKHLVHSASFTHSYPYDWRTKEPVIIRASQQWFVDTNKLKQAALESLNAVEIMPRKLGEERCLAMNSMLQRRPYWCISRQRAWGVPIPVIYHKVSGEHIISRELVEHLCVCIDKYGPDFWWSLSAKDLACKSILSKYSSADALEKGEDIMDIWFDSGISWSYIIPEDEGGKHVADLYLEGVDQFTGWFQSSLMTSCAVQETAPYRKLYIHGFAVDKNGRKMSKSSGNIVDPEEIMFGGKDMKKKPAYGIDALRWWVACHSGHQNNVSVSLELLNASAESVHKLRNSLRFLIGSLNGFKDVVAINEQSPLLDQYLLCLLYDFDQQVSEHYHNFQYNRVCSTIINFITNDVSALYCHLIKDRLYCSPLDSSKRVSCLKTLSHIFDVVSRAVAPILPHLIEEAYLHHPCPKGNRDEGFFRWAAKGNVSLDEQWHNPQVAETMQLALSLRQQLNQKAASIIGERNTRKLGIRIYADEDSMKRLKQLQLEEEDSESELCEILQVSKVSLHKFDEVVEQNDTVLLIKMAEKEHFKLSACVYRLDESAFKCGRCRRYTAVASEKPCRRCQLILDSFQ